MFSYFALLLDKKKYLQVLNCSKKMHENHIKTMFSSHYNDWIILNSLYFARRCIGQQASHRDHTDLLDETKEHCFYDHFRFSYYASLLNVTKHIYSSAVLRCKLQLLYLSI